MNTSETISLQERILNLDFVLYYFVMTDIMPHLTFLLKSVLLGNALPWMFTDNVYLTLKTLNCMKESVILPKLQCSMLLNIALFPKFHECHNIVVSKEYNSCPLPGIPITIVSTRIKTAVKSWKLCGWIFNRENRSLSKNISTSLCKTLKKDLTAEHLRCARVWESSSILSGCFIPILVTMDWYPILLN